MKKVFSILLAVVMLVGMTINTMADGISSNICAEVSFSAENNAISVSGEISSQRDRIPMTLIIRQNGNVVALTEILAVGNNNGKVSYVFDSVKLNKQLPDGELAISVSADMLNLSCEKTYQYVGVGSQFTALSELNEAVASQAPADVLGVINTYSQALGVDTQKLNGFAPDVAVIAAGTMMKSYVLPAQCETDEDIQKIKNALGEFNKVYTKGVATGEFFAKSNISEISQWYDTYKDIYDLDEDIPGTPENEKTMLIYVTTALDDSSFALRREYMKNVTDISELALAIYHQAILHNTEKGNSYIVRNIIDDYPSLLTINLNSWNALTEAQKGIVVANVSGYAYKNFAELSIAIDGAVNSMYAGNQTGTSNDRYSGVSGGGKGSNLDVVPSMPVQNQVMSFSDTAHVAWAEPSIKYLYSKGIVSGKSESMFAPDDDVTRAELVKMLVCALGLTEKEASGENFADVSDSAWYADYVYTAVGQGLIQGVGNGKFSPNSPVSRQDAATIIYRAVNNNDKVQKAYFDDYESISSYARDAVNYLCKKGIINGVGDGKFAPNAKLTRAQAAKILHLFLTN